MAALLPQPQQMSLAQAMNFSLLHQQLLKA
jgi:hypothetical protein